MERIFTLLNIVLHKCNIYAINVWSDCDQNLIGYYNDLNIFVSLYSNHILSICYISTMLF